MKRFKNSEDHDLIICTTYPVNYRTGLAVSILTGLRSGRHGFDFRQGQWANIFLFSTASTQPPIQWVTGALPLQTVKCPGLKLCSHFHFMPRLLMCGTVSPLLRTSSWCYVGATLFLHSLKSFVFLSLLRET